MIKTQFKNGIANLAAKGILNITIIIDLGDDEALYISELIISKTCKVNELKLTKNKIKDRIRSFISDFILSKF